MKPLILGRKLQKIPRVILTFDAMYVHCERLRFEEITWTVSFFLGLGLGLDSDRGCRTGGHAEACGCCLMLPHEWGSELTRVIGLCWLDSPSIAALSESSKQKVCVIDRK